MAILYTHRQFGRTMFFIAIGVAVLLAGIAALVVSSSGAAARGPGFWVTMLLSAAVTLSVLLLFSSLRVTVTEDRVNWQFGPGVLTFSTQVGDITHVEIVHPPLIYGIGIRVTPKGWLYNVSGGKAVAITTGKKTVQIGSDDPDGLMRAIDAARGQLVAQR